LKVPIHAPFRGVFEVKMGKTGNVLVVLSLQESREYMTYIVLTFCESNRVKLVLRFSLVTRAKFEVTKKEKN